MASTFRISVEFLEDGVVTTGASRTIWLGDADDADADMSDAINDVFAKVSGDDHEALLLGAAGFAFASDNWANCGEVILKHLSERRKSQPNESMWMVVSDALRFYCLYAPLGYAPKDGNVSPSPFSKDELDVRIA